MSSVGTKNEAGEEVINVKNLNFGKPFVTPLDTGKCRTRDIWLQHGEAPTHQF